MVAAALLLLSACSGADTEPDAIHADAEELFAQHAARVMRLRPINATWLGLGDEDVGGRINDAMDDYSSDNMRKWRRAATSMQSELAALPADSIDPLTRAALEEIYRVYQGAPLPFGYIDMDGHHQPYVIGQLDQPLELVPYVMSNYQRIETAEDVGDYLRRMWALSSLVNGVLGKFNSDADAGWLAPRPVLEGALTLLDDFVAQPADEHELVTSLLARADASGALTAEERARVKNEAIAVMLRIVYPSYRNAAQAVRERLPEAREAAGLWALPGGEQFYAVAIRNEAMTDMSAEQIHELGLREVERILAEMDAILVAQGYRAGTVGERMRTLTSEPRFLLPDTAEGRAALIARIEETTSAMWSRLPGYFNQLPERGVAVRSIPESEQQNQIQAYFSPPPVGSEDPGVFWINTRSMDELPWFVMPTLTYHETVPGHHLQVSLTYARSDIPPLWRFSTNNAYSEGWAMYAEKLAEEMGVYREDPLGDLGRLRDELFRAVRLVVDTGLHQQRWSMEKAVSYMSDTTGIGDVEVRTEILRYMSWPAQALSYKLGMLAILDMREAARAELGEDFDLAAFHDVVLGTGPVSMPLLRQQVEDWSRR
jgi:uncharacterized protein (DUF885 family)